MKKHYTYRKSKRPKTYHLLPVAAALIVLAVAAFGLRHSIASLIAPAAGLEPPITAGTPDAEDALPSPVVTAQPGGESSPTSSEATQSGRDYRFPAVQDGMVPIVSRIPTKEHVVFLTIDDGIVANPGDARLMKANGVKATFFLVYRFIKRDPGFFAGLAQVTGSDIENHSYDHYILTNLGYDQQKLDICQNADVITQWFGSRPMLFRPSGGAYDSDTRRAAASCGARALIMWDGAINNGRLRVQSGRGLRPGDIVLMHFRTTFSEDLMAFVTAAKAAGLQPDLLVNWL